MFHYTYEDAKLRDDLARAHDLLMAQEPKGILSFLDKWISLLLVAFINNRRLNNIHAQINYFRRSEGMSPQLYTTTVLMDQLSILRGEDYDREYAPYEFEEFDTSHEDERRKRDGEAILDMIRMERDEALRMYEEDPEEFERILKEGMDNDDRS